MGYVFLFVSLIAGVTKGFCGKKTSFSLKCSSDSMIINVLRMFLCVGIGFLLVAINGEISFLKLDGYSLFVYALSGVASATFVVSWLLSVKSGTYMMVEVFLLLGTIVPIVLCRIFFNENISILQIIGFIVLLVAIYIMSTYNSTIKGKTSVKSLLLLILCGLSSGFADFSHELFVKNYPNGSISVFNFYTYAFAILVLFSFYLVFRKDDKKNSLEIRNPFAVLKPIWYFVVIMAVCLFASSFFKTLSAKYLDAVVLYPLNQSLSVTLSLLMSAIFFKERINLKCFIGVCLSFGALLMIVLPNL